MALQLFDSVFNTYTLGILKKAKRLMLFTSNKEAGSVLIFAEQNI
jgi:hypothetical protein